MIASSVEAAGLQFLHKHSGWKDCSVVFCARSIFSYADIMFLAALESHAHIIARMAEDDNGVVAKFPRFVKGIRNQFFSIPLPLVVGMNTYRAERKYLFFSSIISNQFAFCVHDVCNEPAIFFYNKIKRLDEVGMCA